MRINLLLKINHIRAIMSTVGYMVCPSAREGIMKALLLLLIVGFALTAGAAEARMWTIMPDGTGDAPTIKAGMDSASAGDTVSVGCGTYYEHNITVKSGVYLTSETGSPDCVTIDAQKLDRVLYCNGLDSTTYIVGLTLKNAKRLDNVGGGIYCDNSKPRISSCIIQNCFSSYQGGGIYLYHADARITDCDFISNTSGTGGGGMYIRYSKAVVTGCEITGNQQQTNGNSGGGVLSQNSVSQFTDCIFSSNYSMVGFGGGFGSESGDTARFSGCLFANNVSEAGGRDVSGGAIEIGWGGSGPCYVEIEACTFSGNKKGAIEVCNGTASLSNCIIAFSQLGYAVSLFCTGAVEPMLTCCDLYGNEDGDWVGAIADQYSKDGNISADPLFCDRAASDFSLRSDSPCLEAVECGTIGAFGRGCWAPGASVPDGSGSDAAFFHAHAAAPSPFSASTRLDFSLPAAGRAKVVIFDVRGEAVTTLLDRELPAGSHAAVWDGTDSAGRDLPAGTYFAKISTGDQAAVLKIVLIR